ncbi:unnamed protein product [Meloidogyne enterolobii]|uniref:Uncharacterized protein n=1 Tax=Meloidogyne enterolobii TaxID=390850 RepID=A0ACB1A3B2_MELEN
MNNNNNNNNNSSSGTSGVRITRRSARNWITLVSKEASTPKSSKKGFFILDNFFLLFFFLEVTGIASKYLTGVEDEAVVKKLSAKREKEAHERALAFIQNQLLITRRDNWLYEPVEELIGYSSKF